MSPAWLFLPCGILLAACGDQASGSPSGEHYKYVVSQVTVPTDDNTSRALGLDLDGNGTVDNSLGMFVGALTIGGLTSTVNTDTGIDTGTVLLLADLQTADFKNPGVLAGFSLAFGTNPMPTPCADASDTTCRRHLQGDGQFEIDPDGAESAPLAGVLQDGVFKGGAGDLDVAVSFFGPPVRLGLYGARVVVTNPTATALQGVIAGGVLPQELDDQLVPVYRDYMMSLVARDCASAALPPDCGCAQKPLTEESGASDLMLYDHNHDCVISDEEILASELFQGLMAPDVMIGGQLAISFGFGFEAVAATF
jgi:hypothetical protein